MWIVYGIPLTTLKWVWEGLGYGQVPASVAFYALRFVMFMLSFVFEDWALDELLPDKRQKRIALFFVSSSYVTWTYQAHTFSNSIETILVLWCLVLIQRIIDHKERTQVTACIALAFLSILGIFNRITFPAYLVIPSIQLMPHLIRNPKRIVTLALSGLLFFLYAVALDTEFYSGGAIQLRRLLKIFILTPWNNLKYNLDSGNLAQHGLHPFWLHFLANLPQLLGPATLLCMISVRRGTLFWSAIVGIATLSCFRHQEARFLLPAVPLLLSSVRLPVKARKFWLGSWLLFNVLAGILFGIYHQGGVVAAQDWLSKQDGNLQVFWWHTYSPPRWLLDGKNVEVQTVDLMGGQVLEPLLELSNHSCHVYVVAPHNADLPKHLQRGSYSGVDGIKLLWQYKRHIGLDNLDFEHTGIWHTLTDTINSRGLGIWSIHRP